MNIIVLVIDTLRYDYIGANGNDRIRTPNMDRLAAGAWSFDFAFQSSFPTIPFRWDAMTGEYGGPFQTWRPLDFDARTFPEELGKAGYATQLIHSTPHLVNGGHNFDWPFHAWTPIRGAEVDRPWIDACYELPENWAPDPLFDVVPWETIYTDRTVVTYARAHRGRRHPEDWTTARLFTKAADFLRDNARRDNFFLWLDCFDPHEPWDVPPDFARLYDEAPGYDGRVDPRSFLVRNHPDLSEAARRRVAALYAAKVSWVDHWLGHLLDTLEATGLSRNTAFLLTSDHGTKNGEWNVFGKSAPLTEYESRIPLLIRVPGETGKRSAAIVQPQDLYATVMGLAGEPVPEALDSQDLLALARGGGMGRREVALCGRSLNHLQAEGDLPREQRIVCTLFDRERYLQVCADPTQDRLMTIGGREAERGEPSGEAARLRELALDELERRGTDVGIMRWLRSGGREPFPADPVYYKGWPGPAGFMPYFQRLYTGWDGPQTPPEGWPQTK